MSLRNIADTLDSDTAFETVLELDITEAAEGIPEKRGVDNRVPVLQAEIEVTARRRTEVRNLAAQGNRADSVLKKFLYPVGELADAKLWLHEDRL